MLAELKSYYNAEGISAENFKCPHLGSCSSFDPQKFTTAKEAFVSTGYVDNVFPRVLFLSLDSGSASKNPIEKTLESVRRQEEFDCNPLTLPKNKHWYRTHELAYLIVRNFIPDLKLEDAKHYFAHTNSAKCCQNNPGRAQAADVLFSNCRPFIPGEIEILAPDILITQGKWAELVVRQGFRPFSAKEAMNNQEIPDEVFIIQLRQKSAIWLQLYHPNQKNGFYISRNMVNLDGYFKVIRSFFLSHGQERIPKFIKPKIEIDKKEDFAMKDETADATFRKNKRCVVCGKPISGGKNIGKTCEEHQGLLYKYYVNKPGIPDPDLYISIKELCDLANKQFQSRYWLVKLTGGDAGVNPPYAPEFTVYYFEEASPQKKYCRREAIKSLYALAKLE